MRNRGAYTTTATMMHAGGWKTARMIARQVCKGGHSAPAHYSAVATAEQGVGAKYL